MNNHSKWRLDLARTLSRPYAAHPGVAAVIVGGSVARGLADAHSDLELGVFWHSSPPDADRAALLEAGRAELTHSFPYFPDEDLWLDQGYVGGVRLDVIHRTVEGVERGIANALERHDANVYALNALAVLGYAHALYGEPLLARWRGQVGEYPRALAVAVIDAHLEPTPTAWLQQHVERGEWTLLYERLVRDERNILMVVMALEGVYAPHAEFKWLEALEARLPNAPRALSVRLQRVLTQASQDGVNTLHDLWVETYAQVEQRFPEIEQLAKARQWLNKPAERFDKPA